MYRKAVRKAVKCLLLFKDTEEGLSQPEEYVGQHPCFYPRPLESYLQTPYGVWCISRVSFLGRVKVNVAPFPGLLFTQSRPL